MAAIVKMDGQVTKRPSFLVGAPPVSIVERRMVSFGLGTGSPLPAAHTRKCLRPTMAVVSDRVQRAAVAEKAVKFKVRAIVTIRKKNKEDLKDIIGKHIDALYDRLGKNVLLQIVSTEIDQSTRRFRIDPFQLIGSSVSEFLMRLILFLWWRRVDTRSAKRSNEGALKHWLKKSNVNAEKVEYTAEFEVTSDFGTPGAITVMNQHQREFFLESIVLEGFIGGPVYFTCNSWVQSTTVHQEKRIFFTNKVKKH